MINLFILLTTILIFSVLFACFIASKETIEKKELYKNVSGQTFKQIKKSNEQIFKPKLALHNINGLRRWIIYNDFEKVDLGFCSGLHARVKYWSLTGNRITKEEWSKLCS